MSKKANTATARLKQDYLRLKKDPVPYVLAEPVPSNILEWHYVVRGPEKTPYEGGFYHGKLIFPKEFPFQPPSIYMTTPNGRFKVDTRLCLSISDFHPDTWNPTWSVSTILTGLLSFMLEKSSTLGGIHTSDTDKKRYAIQSLEYNLNNQMFCELFPETVELIKEELRHRKSLQNKSGRPSSGGDESMGMIDNLQREQIQFQNALANLAMVIVFAVFAYMVRYVLKSITME